MRNIAFFTLSLSRGGAERVIVNMCNEHFINENQVTIITCMKKKPEYELDERIRLICLDKEENELKRSMIERFTKRRKALKRVLKEIKYDIIVSFLPEPNFLILSLKPSIQIPVVISIRNAPQVEYASKLWYILMRIFYKRADYYVFQTENAKAYFSFFKHIRTNSAVIPNPISRVFLAKHQVCAEKRNVIMTVGRLEKQKNHKLLLEAFAKIETEFPDYLLEIYGEGSLETELRAWIQAHGLEEKIKLCGVTSDVRARMDCAKLFVLPSVYEGLPNALMEAMAVGLPVVATNCIGGGADMLIENRKNGLLVANEDVFALAGAMREVLSNETFADKLAESAKQICNTLLPDKIYEKWDEVVKNIKLK